MNVCCFLSRPPKVTLHSGDFEFAKNYGLLVKQVIKPTGVNTEAQTDKAFCEDGFLINSDTFTGLSSHDARLQITEWAQRHSFGTHQVNYKVKDWLLSRQRYTAHFTL